MRAFHVLPTQTVHIADATALARFAGLLESRRKAYRMTWRSWKSASCLRRKRFSAARARRECAARKARRTRSATTEKEVRKQCATVRISRKPDMNAQDDTLQNVRALRFRFGWNFCGAQPGRIVFKSRSERSSQYSLLPSGLSAIVRRSRPRAQISYDQSDASPGVVAASPECSV